MMENKICCDSYGDDRGTIFKKISNGKRTIFIFKKKFIKVSVTVSGNTTTSKVT